MTMDDHAEMELRLAENLSAAYVAFALRLKSIDGVKKRYLLAEGHQPGEFWLGLARELIQMHKAGKLMPAKPN